MHTSAIQPLNNPASPIGGTQTDFKRDNYRCQKPDEVVAYMKEVREPWVAFKVLAAGAIQPKDVFQYAFEHGADFICVGMYDFQIIKDVNIALSVLNGKLTRQRAWLA